MNAAHYRRIRTAVGALVLGFCVLAFADVGDWLSAATARAGLWFQLTPSMLALTQGAGWIAAGCVGVALLTLMFGRIYCAMLCPLGVLMDLSAWLARRTGKKRKLPYHNGWPRLRLLSVVVCNFPGAGPGLMKQRPTHWLSGARLNPYRATRQGPYTDTG